MEGSLVEKRLQISPFVGRKFGSDRSDGVSPRVVGRQRSKSMNQVVWDHGDGDGEDDGGDGRTGGFRSGQRGGGVRRRWVLTRIEDECRQCGLVVLVLVDGPWGNDEDEQWSRCTDLRAATRRIGIRIRVDLRRAPSQEHKAKRRRSRLGDRRGGRRRRQLQVEVHSSGLHSVNHSSWRLAFERTHADRLLYVLFGPVDSVLGGRSGDEGSLSSSSSKQAGVRTSRASQKPESRVQSQGQGSISGAVTVPARSGGHGRPRACVCASEAACASAGGSLKYVWAMVIADVHYTDRTVLYLPPQQA